MKDKKIHASRQYDKSAEKANRTSPPKRKKKRSKAFRIFKKLMTVIATTLLSLLLVCIITGTIVSTALTVYVLKFMDDSTNVTLQQLEAGSDTFFYGNSLNEAGEEEMVIIHKVKNDFQRIPVDIERIPQHVRDAFVYTEDERFYTHDGVDYKRTFAAFANMFLHFYDTEQGGSTITQQLIKNLTGDSDHTPQRKIREIFAAMQLEKTYSKDEILEEYLNYIGFGGARNGIQLAAIDYFGKNVEELTTPEAAVLAAIPKSPEEYGPFATYRREEDNALVVDGKANNKPRQEYVLYKLYENGAITYDEYQQYLVTPLIYTDSEEYKAAHPEAEAQELKQKENSTSWIVDAVYFEAFKIFKEMYDIEDDYTAKKKIDSGGYKIYTTYDDRMQKYVEEKMKDINNFYPEYPYSYTKYVDIEPFGNPDGEPEEYIPQVGFVALNYDGELLCAVGNVGEKIDSLVTNYAVKTPRQVGSTIKPITTYGYGIESGQIHWGSMIQDLGIFRGEDGNMWPFNYGRVAGSGAKIPVYKALQNSYNTVPAQLLQQFGLEEVYKFSTEKLGLDLNSIDKITYSPMTIGSLTDGVTLENLLNAYLPYGNQGIYNEAHIITRIEDSNQQIIYQNDGNPRQAVSDETAWVMNRLMKNVVENGTGTAARLRNKVVVGKTGTTEDWYDEAFVGLTPDFISGVIVGYKYKQEPLSLSTGVSTKVWYNIIADYIMENYANTPSDFEKVKSVIEAPMCSSTNLIAGQYCGKGAIGYWKSETTENYSPPYCNGAHAYTKPTETTTNTGNGASAGGAAGGETGGSTGGGTGGETGGGTGVETGGGTGGETGGSTGGETAGGTGGETGGAGGESGG